VLLALLVAPSAPGAQEEAWVVRLGAHPRAQEAVRRQVEVFSAQMREVFALWLSRSSRYLPMMKRILAEEGLPEDLAYLALIESGFSPYAYSRSGAAGPWQFMPYTARKYGLRVDFWVDERRDPEKSTRAAAAYLRDLYEMFDSWALAIAAYNSGEGALRRALRRAGARGYWDLMGSRFIKAETLQFVPKFLAARRIALEPERYGFEGIRYEEEFLYDSVLLQGPIDLAVAARLAGTTEETLRLLNPELRRWCTPPSRKSYRLRLPRGSMIRFLQGLRELSPRERFPLWSYRVRKGDTLWEIARRLGLPERLLRELNGLRRGSHLRVGQRLLVPPKGRFIPRRSDHLLLRKDPFAS